MQLGISQNLNHSPGTFHIHSLPDSVLALPVMALADDIGDALSASNVLLRAEPGAGKSTGLPLALLLNGGLPGNPVLSVRLQETLGCAENPSVANGQIPLKVELLSPARRPVQVTTDLANFWRNSYPAVKKDMAGRYPRHVWP